MLLNSKLRPLALSLGMALAATGVMAQTPYDEGQKALREAQYLEAARHFEAAQAGSQADAAMYWRAHALYRAGHHGEASRQLSELARRFPESRWNEEARALQLEHGGNPEDAIEEDKLRIFALSQLMERDLERALPLLIELMRNTGSDRVRRDALFVLGMSDSPRAQEFIAEAARDSSDPELQADAISMLAAAGTEFSMSLLEGLYQQSSSKEVKMAVIHAYLAGESPASLGVILQSETDPDLQREAIHALGAMDATGELRDIYPRLTDVETRQAAIEAFAIGGDVEMLREVLESESSPELRETAIQGIAIHGGDGAVELIESLYDSASTVREKSAILESLVILDEPGWLAMRVVQEESDPELQTMAIHVLGITGETQELAGLYQRFTDVSTRRAVLESMAIAGDSAGIRAIMSSESDPELVAAAIHSLGIDSDPETADMLIGMYDGADHEQKRAIIGSLFIMDQDTALIGIAEKEQDRELRRELIQVIGSMDTEASSEFLFRLLEGGR